MKKRSTSTQLKVRLFGVLSATLKRKSEVEDGCFEDGDYIEGDYEEIQQIENQPEEAAVNLFADDAPIKKRMK